MANNKMNIEGKNYSDIPVWRRYTLTIDLAKHPDDKDSTQKEAARGAGNASGRNCSPENTADRGTG